MPAVPMVTTISSIAVVDAVAVSVKEVPLSSAMDDAEDVRAIFGTSSSTRLKVRLAVLPEVASAPDKVPNDTVIVSAPSETLSFVGVIVVDPVVVPAEMVISLIAA